MAEKNLHPKTLATASCLIAVGTYTQPMPHVHGIGLGIHLLRFDAATATLRELLVSRRSRNPSYFCHSARHGLLYSVSELDEEPSLDVYAIDDAATLRHLCNVPTPGASPCHVSLNPAANHLYISNYGSGELLCYRLDERGLPLPNRRSSCATARDLAATASPAPICIAPCLPRPAIASTAATWEPTHWPGTPYEAQTWR